MAAADVFKECGHTVSVYTELKHHFWLTAVSFAYKLIMILSESLKIIRDFRAVICVYL